MSLKKKLANIRLFNKEKVTVDRENITVHYRGKTIDLEAVVNMLIDIKQGAVYTLRRDENKQIITRKL